ncbi:uncharacterized protein B0I36DRAFT_430413 [Microdochium trichocladiopsis]|uniref:Uncharacterized protein n=1 Tax=Microdochium trichocladiopsis TaxID=1682393 RepID=A0A9P9BVA0_9PEZI|nr:uncharacterized protein B0I36DRAFT_430413 [Microdochium trichocladiopsis]KAH7033117.1 hypothetical protein B0I36DRAFT_430413 [Microdochium trichocladiopsis]
MDFTESAEGFEATAGDHPVEQRLEPLLAGFRELGDTVCRFRARNGVTFSVPSLLRLDLDPAHQLGGLVSTSSHRNLFDTYLSLDTGWLWPAALSHERGAWTGNKTIVTWSYRQLDPCPRSICIRPAWRSTNNFDVRIPDPDGLPRGAPFGKTNQVFERNKEKRNFIQHVSEIYTPGRGGVDERASRMMRFD